MSEANRILVPGIGIVILDLVKHRFEEACELYADEWLGFSETELESMLENPQLHRNPNLGRPRGISPSSKPSSQSPTSQRRALCKPLRDLA
jgi:hypothetical protein